MPKTIAVIDSNSLMHRAYHAVPPTMNAPDGTPTNAVFGFISMFVGLINKAHPDAVVCAFDAGRPKHRMEALKQYKAQRPPMDEELKVQFPLVEHLLEAMNVPIVKIKGWEGDDILGTVAARDDKLGYETLVVTGDKDAYQLASDHTRIVTTKKGITEVAIYGPDQVVERYGVRPDQVPDFLGLKGDPSDNIPGVPGVGPKTAAKLIQRFGGLDGLYENLDKLKGKQLEHVRDNKEAAYHSRIVATIIRDLDFPLDLEGISFPNFDVHKVTDAFNALNFQSKLASILSLGGAQSEIELPWKQPLVGDKAQAVLNAAIAEHQRVGVAACVASDARTGGAPSVPEQASFFEFDERPELCLSVATKNQSLYFDGDAAYDNLVHLVTSGLWAAFDAKRVLQYIYPPDTGKRAYIDEKTLYSIDCFDDALAAYVLNSSSNSYTVDSVSTRYLGGLVPEGASDQDTLSIEACCAYALIDPLRKELSNDETAVVFDEIDTPLIPVLAVMERVGAAIDVDHLHTIGEDTKHKIDDLAKRIYALAGETFNIDSPKQVAHILFDVVGLTPGKKTARGYSTDAKVLTKLSAHHELSALILKYREFAKIESTYIDALPQMRGIDGRLHTSFNEMVTTTGRLSSSDPNLQNIPVRTDFGRHIRTCFIPLAPGEVFLSADYSQIELRLLAHLSQDEHLIDAFKSGADFHAATAARVFNVPIEEVTPELRSRAKAVNFGIVYGQQSYGLAQSLHIGFDEAQEMIDRYFEAYPGVRLYLDSLVKQATEQGYAVTMFGRKRHIPELHAKKAMQRGFGERTAMNHPMQGSAADIIKKAMVSVEHTLLEDYPTAQLMLQVHDELDVSVPKADAAKVGAMIKDVMEHVVELRVPLEVEVSQAENWALAH